MKTFSIITAVYNGEKFVENCIKAILNTNYDLNLIEHIIVDDGSTDNTKKICEEYAKKYSHIKFYSKPNGNWGSVINFVKNNKLASNDYIVVCDADDMLVKTAFRTINEKCKDEDLFASSFYLWNGKSKKIKITPYFFLFKKHFVKKDLWNYHSSLIIPASGWIKKEIFYSIPDLKEKVSYQDTVLFTHAFLKAKTIGYTVKGTYLYWQSRPGNSMSEFTDEKGLEKMIGNFSFYEQEKWLNPFLFHLIGVKKIRKYLKRKNLTYDFKGIKPNFTGFPAIVRPILFILYCCFVKKFIKK